MLVRAVIPPATLAQRADAIAAALAAANRTGITTMVDAAASEDDVAAYRLLRSRGPLGVRIRLCQRFDPQQPDDAQIRRFVATRDALGGDLRADCVKVILDGGYGSRSVALLEPYADDPHGGRGQTFVAPERLRALVERLDAQDLQMHIHAIGDRTVREALDAIASARRVNGHRGTRHTLAHLSLIDPADVPRFRQLGVVANMTPLWSRGDPWQTVFAVRMFGAARAEQAYRTRSLLDAGAVLVWGSDWPVTGVAPLAGLETAVTHRYPGGRDPAGAVDAVWNPAERLSLPQALAGYGAAGAWLLHEEKERGSIAPGLLADLVVLERNLFEVPPLAIHDVAVDMTVLGGRVVYARDGAGAAP
jgi:predicted amidohydrolase YtcJ